MSLVEAKGLEKHYGDDVVLERLNFSVEPGEFVTIVGASGCGKTTFLKMMLGTESITKGQLLVDDKPIPGEPGPDRGVVFQRYSVFPHLTVLGNTIIAEELSRSRVFGKLFGPGRRKAREAAMERLTQVGLQHALDKYPHELSMDFVGAGIGDARGEPTGEGMQMSHRCRVGVAARSNGPVRMVLGLLGVLGFLFKKKQIFLYSA